MDAPSMPTEELVLYDTHERPRYVKDLGITVRSEIHGGKVVVYIKPREPGEGRKRLVSVRRKNC